VDWFAVEMATGKRCVRCGSQRVVSSVWGGKLRKVWKIGWVCYRCLGELEEEALRLNKKPQREIDELAFGYERVEPERVQGSFNKGITVMIGMKKPPGEIFQETLSSPDNLSSVW
jgi:hypothetical protein